MLHVLPVKLPQPPQTLQTLQSQLTKQSQPILPILPILTALEILPTLPMRVKKRMMGLELQNQLLSRSTIQKLKADL